MNLRVIREPSLNATTLSIVLLDDRFFSSRRPRAAALDFTDSGSAYSELPGDCRALNAIGEHAPDLKHGVVVDLGIRVSGSALLPKTSANRMPDVLLAGCQLKVVKSIVRFISIEMVDLQISRLAKGLNDESVNFSNPNRAAFAQVDHPVAVVVIRRLQDALGIEKRPGLLSAWKRFYAAKIRHLVQPFVSGDRLPGLIHGGAIFS